MRLQISNVWHILITCPQPSRCLCGERHSRPLRVLRGATDFVATWQSAGKHPCNNNAIYICHALTSTPRGHAVKGIYYNVVLYSLKKIITLMHYSNCHCEARLTLSQRGNLLESALVTIMQFVFAMLSLKPRRGMRSKAA